MNQETKDVVTAAQALRKLKEGNARFSSNVAVNKDVLARIENTKDGQQPYAVVLSCMDSRTPVELIFDQGIGDVFSIRIAGNIVTDGILGSLEYAVDKVGSKLIVVMGHTDCGAIKAACDGGAETIKEGFIPGLLTHISPALEKANETTPTDRSSTNRAYVSRVTDYNISNSVHEILNRSAILRKHVEDSDSSNQAMIVGATYNVATGKVHFEEVLAMA